MGQHHVPQFILKGFTSGGRKQVFVYDKHQGKTFRSATTNISSEKGYYDFEHDGRVESIDPAFTSLEGESARIVKQITATETVDGLTKEQRWILSLFAAAQKLRVPAVRSQWEHTIQITKDHFSAEGCDPSSVWPMHESLTKNDIKRETIMFVADASIEFAHQFANKLWILFKAPKSAPFWVSDNPVVMRNTLNRDPFGGTTGLASPGIEIYFPLSSTLNLGFLCPSIRGLIESKGVGNLQPSPICHMMRDSLDGKGLVSMSKPQVGGLNLLQVLYSNRFLYASTGDFSLAEIAISKHPECRQGLMPEIMKPPNRAL